MSNNRRVHWESDTSYVSDIIIVPQTRDVYNSFITHDGNKWQCYCLRCKLLKKSLTFDSTPSAKSHYEVSLREEIRENELIILKRWAASKVLVKRAAKLDCF